MSSNLVTRSAFKLQDFDLVQKLGDGSYSEVYQVVLQSTGARYALKVVDKHLILRHKQVEAIKQERQLLAGLNHPGIVKLHFTFQDTDSLYFGLECCPNGELFDQIQRQKKLQIHSARFYTAEIIEILAYLKAEKIVHRDLKPENLLLDEKGHLKLCDFGSAKVIQPDLISLQQTDLVGTADYSSPEALKGKKIGYEADLWALGCIVYQMLVGKPPFRAASEYLTFKRIEEHDLQIPEDLDTDAADFIRSLLKEGPESRLGSGQAGFDKLKSHDFLQGIDWHELWAQQAPEVFPGVKEELESEEEVSWAFESLALGSSKFQDC